MLFERFTLYRTGEGGYHGRRIPALITTQPGTILAFNGGRRDTRRDSDQIDLLVRRSVDGGRTFGEVQRSCRSTAGSAATRPRCRIATPAPSGCPSAATCATTRTPRMPGKR